jgi:hypothetical protein
MIKIKQIYADDNFDILLEARALLAVGIDGRFVVLDVNSENEYLASDVRAFGEHLGDVMKCSPESMPLEAGLYEFKGFSARENLPGFGNRLIHRGTCTKIAC